MMKLARMEGRLKKLIREFNTGKAIIAGAAGVR